MRTWIYLSPLLQSMLMYKVFPNDPSFGAMAGSPNPLRSQSDTEIDKIEWFSQRLGPWLTLKNFELGIRKGYQGLRAIALLSGGVYPSSDWIASWPIEDESSFPLADAIGIVQLAAALGVPDQGDIIQYPCALKLTLAQADEEVPAGVPGAGEVFDDNGNSLGNRTWRDWPASTSTVFEDATHLYIPTSRHNGFELAISQIVALQATGFEVVTQQEYRSISAVAE